MAHDISFSASAKRTITMERDAVAALDARIDASFDHACELILQCEGRVVVTGMGKSGHIGNKIAATLASTGTPAMFVHPGEASHGDLGMITPKDVVLALSNSGTTAEIVTLIPLLKRMRVPVISMTGNPHSTLAQASDAHLNVGVATEACPLDLAPTSSTTVTLVMGDALAIALLEARGFTAEDFAFSHPGGALGRKLLLRVSDVMHSGDAIPCVNETTTVKNALLEMSSKGLGMTCIQNNAGQLSGVYTDGDLRRSLDQSIDFGNTPVTHVMTKNCKTIAPDALAAEALAIMEEKLITSLVVSEKGDDIAGVVHLHDLLKAGLA
ncbi:MAG TPA: KpsF/GutQ family sugar-phosphate isomerase [Pseudomonadales bacterium]|nr:KpsF/GutQ family sugar-phosphate isomerase [Pseudomonadales bacterium]